MARLLKLKLFLISLAIILGGWNYFLRDKINLPYLSGLSPSTVYIIVGIIIVIDVIINFKAKSY